MARTLSAIELDSRLATVRREWDWTGWDWYPLHVTSRKDVLAFGSVSLEAVMPDKALRELLVSCGISNVFWFRGRDMAEETRIDQVPFLYSAQESFIVDESLKWIVYWSDEGTITFGGRQLIERIQAKVANWREFESTPADDYDAI